MNSFHFFLIFSLYVYMLFSDYLIKGGAGAEGGRVLKKSTKSNRGRGVKPISMFTL